MRWRVNEEWFENHVQNLMNVIRQEKDMPPLIVHFLADAENPDGYFELNDGNHRHEAYKRLGIDAYPVIVWITEETERALFLEKYGHYLE